MDDPKSSMLTHLRKDTAHSVSIAIARALLPHKRQTDSVENRRLITMLSTGVFEKGLLADVSDDKLKKAQGFLREFQDIGVGQDSPAQLLAQWLNSRVRADGDMPSEEQVAVRASFCSILWHGRLVAVCTPLEHMI